MSTEKNTKLNHLLTSQPSGIVFQSAWLKKEGYSAELQKRYRLSNWLESIGSGAMIRAGDSVGYEGAVYALQKQSNFTIHPGAKTALSLLGKAHYLQLGQKTVTVFGGKQDRLPTWFQKNDWGLTIEYYQSSFLPPGEGLTQIELKNFSIKISGAARAFMECLYLAPQHQELKECYELMEGLNNLRPAHVQPLLEKCQSIKVKRLFLYMAEKAGHEWFKHITTKKIDLGSGKRSLVKDGIFIEKYQITVPRELEKNGE